ncbi:MAG: M67 family metallopeptidase [Rhizomicrobium sp.]
MTALHLPPGLCEQIEREARHAYPNECCGLLEGSDDGAHIVVAAAHAARNLSEHPDRFEIDPADQFRVLRAARERGREVVGCYHSHPNGRPRPSVCDRQGAGETGFAWLIAAVSAGGDTAIEAYIFDGNAFLPLAFSQDASLDPARGLRV